MKKISGIFFAILTMIVAIPTVYAAPTFSTGVSKSTIEVGTSVTASITLNNVAAWDIKITSTGATSGCSTHSVDVTADGKNTKKTISVTCKSTSTGTINFNFSGTATGSDYSNTNINEDKRVIVKEATPKSNNNYLKGLTVGEYILNPTFNKETMAYSVTVPSTINEVEIGATKEDSTSIISGTGKRILDKEVNVFDIVVTSESGTDRTYRITVSVKDENPIATTIEGINYNVVKNATLLEKPELFEATTISIDGIEVPAFKNEFLEEVLIGLKDETGNIVFGLYSTSKNEYKLYKEIRTNDLVLMLLDTLEEIKGFENANIEVLGYTLKGLKTKHNDFVITYAKNLVNGETNMYQYDAKEKTLQRYFKEEMAIEESDDYLKYAVMGFAGLSIVLLIALLIVGTKKSGKKKRKYLEKDINEIVTNETQSEEIKNDEVEVSEPIEEDNTKKSKKNKKKSKKQEKNNEEKKEESQPEQKINEDIKVETVTFKEDQIGNLSSVSDATKMIEDFEKTIEISKAELDKQKNLVEDDTSIEDMYQFFDDKKKKKKRK